MKSHKDYEDIAYTDLEIKGTLGCGAFGRVKLVKHKENGKCFALKCLTKTDIVANNLQEHIINERVQNEKLRHPSPRGVTESGRRQTLKVVG